MTFIRTAMPPVRKVMLADQKADLGSISNGNGSMSTAERLGPARSITDIWSNKKGRPSFSNTHEMYRIGAACSLLIQVMVLLFESW